MKKHKLIQHTNQYPKPVEQQEQAITHHHKSFENLRGLARIKVHGNINETILPGFDEWE